jgi:prephenate dehydratase/chorismate mutase/prephenate dehydratase
MNKKDFKLELEKIDLQLLKLLDARTELCLKAKKIHDDVDAEIEGQIFDVISSRSWGLISRKFAKSMYSSIVQEINRLKGKELKLIGFQGEHGAYSEMASMIWDKKLIPIPCSEFTDVFEGVSSGLFDLGIVPVENSLGGVVSQVNQLIINTKLHVVGAVELGVHHCLLAPPGTDYRELRAAYSHSQALEQCHNFLERNNLEAIPYYDTAGSARMLAERAPKSTAAIASKLAAEIYNLEIIKENIEDFNRNITRFLIFAKSDPKTSGNKCSIIFSTSHKAGVLFEVLKVFADKGINLTRIESLPNKQGSYAFFLDFIGSREDKKVQNALDMVKKNTAEFRLLGCYDEKIVKDK